MNKPEVTYRGLLDMQVCVPKEYTDEQVIKFAEKENPCGTMHGWGVRKQGHKLLGGSNERVQCSKNPNKCHIMLNA